MGYGQHTLLQPPPGHQFIAQHLEFTAAMPMASERGVDGSFLKLLDVALCRGECLFPGSQEVRIQRLQVIL